jgi:hypothetical protein
MADDIHEADLLGGRDDLFHQIRAARRIIGAADVDDGDFLEGSKLSLRWLTEHSISPFDQTVAKMQIYSAGMPLT